ncbi:alkaline phosphatase family protein [Propioniciclava coleopterorum]|uniref:Alkaline phosphatase family protein n=1 Tax=Propioniciclava coleopterorum TaxID=2714937 RepID=A0A6G7Y9E1_9ACTN|nr:nucleotide pyrophosphatase/phosphodiesterase family protein [Propioniciclava coleopterorum]QIK73425.1 alkaline phosphatase family protein [Propioniciclava coleopterorum]
MTEVLAAAPIVPTYGAGALSDVVPSMAASLGLPGWTDVLGLPEAPRWVLMLVDGLGDLNLAAAAADAPFLTSLRETGGALTAGVPSTTATSITSLGTGLTPGQHGMVGYSFRNPVDGGLLNALAWQDGLSAYDVQPRLTAFERLARAGVALTTVSPARFAGTGLTEAALRGARFQPVPDESDHAARIGWTADAAASGQRSLVYLYERSLDHTGHGQGWGSPQWREALRRVDALARDVRAALPADARLLITGDHGMIDAPRDRWVIVEDVPELGAEVTLLAGEGRLRQLYARPEHVAAVADRWRDVLGERAWVLTRDEAIDADWFGPVDGRMASRIGDVLVAMRDDGAVMTRTQPREFGLVGMHGSLTELETRVPLLVA